MNATNKITIDKDFPIPTGGKYPFKEMEVGDSFFVAGKKITDISGVIGSHRKQNPERKYITRTVEGGVRVWRTK